MVRLGKKSSFPLHINLALEIDEIGLSMFLSHKRVQNLMLYPTEYVGEFERKLTILIITVQTEKNSTGSIFELFVKKWFLYLCIRRKSRSWILVDFSKYTETYPSLLQARNINRATPAPK